MPVSDAPTRPLGTLHSGGGGWGSWYEDALEHVPDVTYPDSIRTYGRMRRDPTLASIIAGYTNPVVAGHWHVDPSGCTDQVVRAVADSLGLPVLGDDTTGPATPGADRNRAVQWKAHLRIAALKLVWGHIAAEPYYRVDSGRAILAGLPERMPYSIDRIHVDENTGQFLGITQTSSTTRVSSDTPELRADRLVWYTHQREGAAWWGQSILRPAFGPWLLKAEAMRVHATSLRRFGAGTPVMEPVAGTVPTPAQIQQAQAAAAAVRVGDTGGVATPGFTLRIKGVEGAIPDALPFLRYLDEQMARAALMSILDLGSTANGSRALGDNFADILAMALQAVADDIATDATLQLAGPIATFNAGPAAAVPRIVVGDVAATEQALAETVARLITAGALSNDPDLEAWVRRAFDLPPKPAGAAPVVAPVKANRRPVRAAGDPVWPYHRQLTAVEAKAGLDPQAIDDAATQIVDDAMTGWPDITAAQYDALVAAVVAALVAGDLTALAALTVDSTAAGDALAAAVEAAAAAGVTLAVGEAATAGVTIPAAVVDTEALAGWARALAASLAEGLATAAGREALRLAGPDPDPQAVGDAVRGWLDTLTDGAPREAVEATVQAGINGGRTAAVDGGPSGARYHHSAIRDHATCANCQAADGVEYPDLDAVKAAFPTGGYRDCLGRFRCRCIAAVTWGDG
jgi:hypothetical protein